MIKLNIVTPTRCEVYGDDSSLNKVKKLLAYKSDSVNFLLKKHKKNIWWRRSNPETYDTRYKELMSQVNVNLYWIENGVVNMRPGGISYLQEHGVEIDTINNNIKYPSPKLMPWAKKPPFDLYPYQKLSVEKLIEAKHGAVELCTGAGKTWVILMLAKTLGLRTIISTPSASIFNQVLEECELHFGKQYVGALGDGRKKMGKQITVCVSKSLSMVKEGTKEWEWLSQAQVTINDEAHTIPSATLEKMCHGILANVPYRFFCSGTLTRSDSSKEMLKQIIGPVVYSLSTAEAIQGGYVGDHEFRVVSLKSMSSVSSDDAIELKREHILRNNDIALWVANFCNSVVKYKSQNVLVLVEELDQISKLTKLLEVPYAYAHGEGKSNKELPEGDSGVAVEKFNRGEAKVLIGTACISTGTNIFANHHTINWQGGSSEIKTKQGAVGRSVRRLTGSKYEQFHTKKDKCVIWDFKISDINIEDDIKQERVKTTLDRHLAARIDYYKDSERPITFI